MPSQAIQVIAHEAQRTLEAAAAGGPKPWYQGKIRYENNGTKPELVVGGVFDLRDEPFPMGQLIGRYRLVAMAVAPEGYLAILGYADDFTPANGAPIPTIDKSMVIKDEVIA